MGQANSLVAALQAQLEEPGEGRRLELSFWSQRDGQRRADVASDSHARATLATAGTRMAAARADQAGGSGGGTAGAAAGAAAAAALAGLGGVRW